MEPCNVCQGRGWIPSDEVIWLGPPIETCPGCNGSGKQKEEPLPQTSEVIE